MNDKDPLTILSSFRGINLFWNFKGYPTCWGREFHWQLINKVNKQDLNGDRHWHVKRSKVKGLGREQVSIIMPFRAAHYPWTWSEWALVPAGSGWRWVPRLWSPLKNKTTTTNVFLWCCSSEKEQFAQTWIIVLRSDNPNASLQLDFTDLWPWHIQNFQACKTGRAEAYNWSAGCECHLIKCGEFPVWK